MMNNEQEILMSYAKRNHTMISQNSKIINISLHVSTASIILNKILYFSLFMNVKNLTGAVV
jgi:hypothetical protein